jgi:hypothetical protein
MDLKEPISLQPLSKLAEEEDVYVTLALKMSSI